MAENKNENSYIDPDSAAALDSLNQIEAVRKNRYPDVRTVLVVLSSDGMVFDVDSLRQKIQMSYADAAIFFQTTSGKALGGMACPRSADLLIDLTGPQQRQGIFYAHKLRRMAKYAVGRNVGLFRKRIYNRIFDEKSRSNRTKLPKDLLDKERFVQKEVLSLAGVPFAPAADVTEDLGKNIALELPPLAR